MYVKHHMPIFKCFNFYPCTASQNVQLTYNKLTCYSKPHCGKYYNHYYGADHCYHGNNISSGSDDNNIKHHPKPSYIYLYKFFIKHYKKHYYDYWSGSGQHYHDYDRPKGSASFLHTFSQHLIINMIISMALVMIHHTITIMIISTTIMMRHHLLIMITIMDQVIAIMVITIHLIRLYNIT